MVPDALGGFPFKKPENLGSVLVVMHRNADVDAYASAYGVAHLLRRLNSMCRVVAASPEGLSVLARQVQAKYPMEVTDAPSFKEQDMIVIVDTGHAELLSGWLDPIREAECSKVLIDHHPYSRSGEQFITHMLVDEEATSTSEIVLAIYESKHVRVPQKVAEVLLLGVLTDTANLSISECSTLESVVKLCKAGAALSKARLILKVKRDVSEKMARLKALQRLKIYRLGDWIFALTYVSSFQASVAKALIDLGADVAVALGEVDEEVRGSLRATQEFCEKSGIHLGTDIAEKVGASLYGSGGGHAGAASFKAKAPLHSVSDTLLLTLAERVDVGLQEVA